MIRETQYRVMIPNGEDLVGCQWRVELPTKEELAEWREDFDCEVWVERREVLYYDPERMEL